MVIGEISEKVHYAIEVSIRMQIVIKSLKNEDFVKISDLIRNVPEISERKSGRLSPDSTSLPDVNLVDGLPSA